jgi:hypothetical protein
VVYGKATGGWEEESEREEAEELFRSLADAGVEGKVWDFDAEEGCLSEKGSGYHEEDSVIQQSGEVDGLMGRRVGKVGLQMR